MLGLELRIELTALLRGAGELLEPCPHMPDAGDDRVSGCTGVVFIGRRGAATGTAASVVPRRPDALRTPLTSKCAPTRAV